MAALTVAVVGSLALVGCSSSDESATDPTGSAAGSVASSVPTQASAPTISSPPPTTGPQRTSSPPTTASPEGPGLEYTELIGFEGDTAVAETALTVLEDLLVVPRSEVLTPVAAAAAGDREFLPEGAEMTIRRSTWERRGRLAAVVVEVRLNGSDAPDEFVAFLVATDDGWRLSHTERVAS